MKMENPYREDGRNSSRWQLNTDLRNGRDEHTYCRTKVPDQRGIHYLLDIPAVEELNVRTVTEAVSKRWRTCI